VPNFADLRTAQEELVRKTLDGAVFRKSIGDGTDHISVDVLFDDTALTKGELLELPTGWEDQGLLSTAGITFGREVSTSNTSALGRTTPVRSDVQGDTDTLNFVAIETNRQSIELGTGAVVAAGSRDNATGALEIKKPPRPKARAYRWLSVAQDENEFGEVYVCRYLPRGKITSYGEQAFVSGDDAIGWGATITGENDSAWGSPGSWLFGGPGWNALLVKMGFTALT
jgi:hypothetical protein